MKKKFENLTGAKENKEDTILGILPRVDLNSHTNSRFNINCHFIDYDENIQKRDDYFDFIHNTLLTYILERKKLNNLSPKDAIKLNKEAKGKIWNILKEENEKNDGLLGEWNLYLFLEYIENAKKLVSRMSLDTATQGNRKGLDGIHFKIGEDNKIYTYLLEAKVYKDIKKGLKDSFVSINKFFFDKRYKDEQINIIKEHLDLNGDEELEKYLLDSNFFTPDSIVEKKEILSIFIMFDSNVLKDIEEKHNKLFKTKNDLINDIKYEIGKYIEDKIYDELESQISSSTFKESSVQRTKEEIKIDKDKGIKKIAITKTIDVENKIKNKEFIFYLMPVKDVVNLRIDFKNHIMKN